MFSRCHKTCRRIVVSRTNNAGALFAADDKRSEAERIAHVRDEMDDCLAGGEVVVCGQGFYQQTGPDGDYCVFDYDAAASAFGTAEEVVEDAEEYWEVLDVQNRARAKFGMEPLTPEEYVALQAQIHLMEAKQIADATEKIFSEFDKNGDGVISVEELKEGLETSLRTDISEEQVQKLLEHFDTSGDGLLQPDEFVTLDQLRSKFNAIVKEQDLETLKQPGFFKNLMDNTLFQDTCESNFDCERPEVCCDFHFKKMCCSSGQMAQELRLEYATVPIPQNH